MDHFARAGLSARIFWDRSNSVDLSVQFALRQWGVLFGAKLYVPSMFCSPGKDSPLPKRGAKWSVPKCVSLNKRGYKEVLNALSSKLIK